MLTVKPVPVHEIAEELCTFCNIPYSTDVYTYFAADVNEDDTKINHIIGVCTFIMKGGVNRIEYLTPAVGIDDEEAMIIMARTVMNFMYRCEADKVTVSEYGVSEEMKKKLGFIRNGEVLPIDLNEFYKSPCKYNG